MEIILHRINKIKDLKTVNPLFGVEIDIRTYGKDLILSHDPFKKGDKLEDYLSEYRHGTLVLNIKESGIKKTRDQRVVDVVTFSFPILFNFKVKIPPIE